MPKMTTKPWDPAEHLATEEDKAAYLEAALEEGDPALVAAALGDIARAKGMTQDARDIGLGARACTRRSRLRPTRSLQPS
jgi:probable addiction module antidote protein